MFDDILGTQKANQGASGGGSFDDVINSQPDVVPGHALGTYRSQAVRDSLREFKAYQKEVDRENEYHPWQAFKEGWTGHKMEERGFKEFFRGDPVREGGKVVGEAMLDLRNRAGTAFRPAVDAYIDKGEIDKSAIIAGVGNMVLGMANVGFSTIMGGLKGAENAPFVGWVPGIVNKLGAGIFSVFNETGIEGINALPIAESTKRDLAPVVGEALGFIGTIGAFRGGAKYGGKVYGKVKPKITENQYVKPKIEAFERKLNEMGEILARDPLVTREVARFLTEHGPARNLPVISETPTSRTIPVTPSQRHAAYAEQMGYEPYTAAKDLPTIQFGERLPVDETIPTVEVPAGRAPDRATLPDIEFGGETPTAKTAQGATTKTAKGKPVKGEKVAKKTEPRTQQEPAARRTPVDINGKKIELTDVEYADYLKVRAEHDALMTELQKSYQEAAEQRGRTEYYKAIAAEEARWSDYTKVIDGSLKGLKPVEQNIGGEKKAPSAAKTAARKFADDTRRAYSDLPEYERMNIEKDADNALRIVREDPEQARGLAMGELHRKDVTNTSVWRALVEDAERRGDTQLLMDLSRSPVVEVLTRFGQENVALRGMDKSNPAKIMGDYTKWRKERFEKRRKGNPEEAIRREMANIEQAIRENAFTVEEAIALLRKMECK